MLRGQELKSKGLFPIAQQAAAMLCVQTYNAFNYETRGDANCVIPFINQIYSLTRKSFIIEA